MALLGREAELSRLRAALDGSAGIRLVLQNSDIADGVPSDMKPELPEIREVANIGNFERGSLVL